VVLRVGDGDEAAAGPQHPRELCEGLVEARHVVQDAVREHAIEGVVGKREMIDGAHDRVEAARPGEVDHARREVERNHVDVEVALQPLREVAGAATDVENAGRRAFRNRSSVAYSRRTVAGSLTRDGRGSANSPPLKASERRWWLGPGARSVH
jgi:hypothetical protein